MDKDSQTSYLQFLSDSTTRPVWIQAIGRFLYLISYTAIQFYIPLIFVHQVGLSATTVGIALGTGSLAGVVGHLLGGYLADAPTYGRKRGLLLAGLLAILAAALLAFTQTLPLLLVANLLLGLSAGCYWTAADVTVVDVTALNQRQMAFALLVLADSLGGGVGVWAGGLLLPHSHQAQHLFGVSILPLVLFLGLMQFTMVETRPHNVHTDPVVGFGIALRDRSLLLFVLVNILFTTYMALVSSTLPLYLTQTLATLYPSHDSAVRQVANLFTGFYIGLGAVLQLPIVQALQSWSKPIVLILSMLLWGIGFGLIWLVSMTPSVIIGTSIALSVLAIAGSTHKPFAPTIVAELAPVSLRGVYLAISYQCWSIGYFIGPIVGGWAIEQPAPIAHHLWLLMGSTTLVGLVVLYTLAQRSIPASEPVTDPQTIETAP